MKHLHLSVEKQKKKVSRQLECYGMKPSKEDLQKMSPVLSFSFLHQNRDNHNFIVWADNCSGQNKNWFLYTTLVNKAKLEQQMKSQLKILSLDKSYVH